MNSMAYFVYFLELLDLELNSLPFLSYEQMNDVTFKEKLYSFELK